MNAADLHEFCLDWQEGIVSKDVLWIEFISKGWHFREFKKLAQKNGWYISSMDVLQALD